MKNKTNSLLDFKIGDLGPSTVKYILCCDISVWVLTFYLNRSDHTVFCNLKDGQPRNKIVYELWNYALAVVYFA